MDKKQLVALNKISQQMLEDMFSYQVNDVKVGFECIRPPFNDRFITLLAMGNGSYQAQIVLSFPTSIMEDILSSVIPLAKTPEERDELVMTSIGELANTIAGEFANLPEIKEKYGILELFTPSVWDLNVDIKPHFLHSDGRTGQIGPVKTFFSVKKLKNIDINSDKTDNIDFSDLDELFT